MSSGAYVALSGLQARAEQLNRLADDLANVNTAGYKAERGTTAAAERPVDAFSNALQSAIEVAEGPRSLDLRSGAVTPTGRDLDLAIDGRGFFVVQTPEGIRYTRNGHFTRRADNVLATEHGYAVLGETGPLTLPAGGGALRIGEGGEILSGDTPIGRPQIVDFPQAVGLSREDGALFRAGAGSVPMPVTGTNFVAGAVEQSNVSPVERMASLTAVSRSFEALQRGVTIMSADAALANDAVKAANESPDIRAELVERMRALLASGELGSDAGALADSLIDSMIDKTQPTDKK
jgi:flagellar basal-body rod protein FlgF